jgi:heat shock protein HslJ
MNNLFIYLIIFSFSGVSQAAGMPNSEPMPVEYDSEDSSQSMMTNERTQSGLEAPDWQLSHYRDESGQMLSVLPDTTVTARFRSGELGGSAGCNRYFGSYTLGTDDQLSFSSPMGTTMMACGPPVSEQERQYLNDLSAVVAFQLEGGSLYLLDKNRKVILEYTAVKPLALEGTLWQAAGINNGRGGVVSTATTPLATARFEDGTISGHAGCNTFNAAYEVTGNRISLGPAMTTRMHCAEPDGIMDQEQEYLAALSRARVYELTDSGLKLRDENGSLQVNFVAGDKAQ